MFPSLKQDGKKAVLNARTESGPGKECSRMLGTLLFPDFYGKNPVRGKWHSGMQTSTSQPNININYAVIYSINFDRFFKKRLNKTWQKIFWFKISKKKCWLLHNQNSMLWKWEGKWWGTLGTNSTKNYRGTFLQFRFWVWITDNHSLEIE